MSPVLSLLTRRLFGSLPRHAPPFALPAANPPRAAFAVWAVRIPAGFPSPADDYLSDRLDLNLFMVDRPAATFFIRVQGHSQRDNGIFDGDVLSVDRSVEPVSGKLVVAVLYGEFAIKKLEVTPGGVRLLAANPDYPAIEVKDPDELTIWGVVTGVMRKF